jgi:hypothetical protein
MKKPLKSLFFLLLIFLLVIFFYQETTVSSILAIYSSATKGRNLVVGNTVIAVPFKWYLSTQGGNKMYRISFKNTPLVAAFFEAEDVEKFLADKKFENPPNIKIGQYIGYNFLLKKPCIGMDADCYHTIMMIPSLGLKVTVSNYLEDQTFVVDEITETIASAKH